MSAIPGEYNPFELIVNQELVADELKMKGRMISNLFRIIPQGVKSITVENVLELIEADWIKSKGAQIPRSVSRDLANMIWFNYMNGVVRVHEILKPEIHSANKLSNLKNALFNRIGKMGTNAINYLRERPLVHNLESKALTFEVPKYHLDGKETVEVTSFYYDLKCNYTQARVTTVEREILPDDKQIISSQGLVYRVGEVPYEVLEFELL